MVSSTLDYKRVTIFAGHYGSGKTNIAVNFALEIAKREKKVAIADLDIVNPYFRSKDSEDVMKEHGIRLISSPYANSNVDTPALPADAYAVTDDKELFSVVDVGGDDRGALALGRYAAKIVEEGNYEMLFVISKYRPLTKTPDEAVGIMKEIEMADGVKFTGIVNNSNLGDETSEGDVLNSLEYAKKVSELSGLPIRMTTVKESLFKGLENKIENLVPLKLYVKQSWSR